MIVGPLLLPATAAPLSARDSGRERHEGMQQAQVVPDDQCCRYRAVLCSGGGVIPHGLITRVPSRSIHSRDEPAQAQPVEAMPHRLALAVALPGCVSSGRPGSVRTAPPRNWPSQFIGMKCAVPDLVPECGKLDAANIGRTDAQSETVSCSAENAARRCQ